MRDSLMPCMMSTHTNHATPKELDKEFQFDFDPCPLNPTPEFDGLKVSWQNKRVYCNPPYGRGIGDWLNKGIEADLAVFLLPSRTDTKWWHDIVLPKAKEIRFAKNADN